MNTIIKLFLVLCCNTQTPQGTPTYEVKDLQTNSYGTIFTEKNYQEGDTIKMVVRQPIK